MLVGTAASGKSTLRRRWLAGGYPPDSVVSLDDLRRAARADDLARGRPARPLQDYSASAVRRARRRADALAAWGAGYLADATHLRRRDRVLHVRTARGTGLPVTAVLTPLVDLAELLRRDALRPADEQVPPDVLAQQHHRRSLLTAERLLVEDGFDEVLELPEVPVPPVDR